MSKTKRYRLDLDRWETVYSWWIFKIYKYSLFQKKTKWRLFKKKGDVRYI